MTRPRRVPRREPSGLRATVIDAGKDCYVVLSYPAPGAGRVPALTPAEREVLGLLLAGSSNAAIARRRGTAVRTVANQVAALFRKIGVSSRSELASALARES